MAILFVRRLLVLLGLIVSTPSPELAADDLIFRTSHTGPVTTLAPADSQFLSGGQDGMVRVWEAGRRNLVNTLRVADSPIALLAAHPDERQFAAITERGGSYFLSAHDRLSGEQLFRRELSSVPLFMRYSTFGNYLIVTTAEFQSLSFYDSRSGRRRNLLDEAFGIVSFVTVSQSNENTIMTYAPGSGSIVYWNLQQVRARARVNGRRDLENLIVLGNNRYAAASSGETLFVIDITNGSTVAQTDIGEITRLAYDESDNTIAVLFGEPTGIARYRFESGTLRRESGREPEVPADVTTMVYADGQLITGQSDGSVATYFSFSGRRRGFRTTELTPITGASFSGGRLHVATAESIISFRSNGLSPSAEPEQTRFLRAQRVTNPIDGATTLVERRAGELLALPGSLAMGQPRLFDANSGSFQSLSELSLESPVRRAMPVGDGIALVERNGGLTVLSSDELEPRFRFSSLGLQAAAQIAEARLVVGKTGASGFLDSALLEVDTTTGETVPISTEMSAVFGLARVENELLVLGLRGGDGARTSLMEHDIEELEAAEEVFSVNYEDLDATLIHAAAFDRVFTTLGDDGIRSYDGRRVRSLAPASATPLELGIAGPYLFSINADGTLSGWQPESGEEVFRLAVFTPEEWLIVTNDGLFLAPGGVDAAGYLAIREGENGSSSGDIADRRSGVSVGVSVVGAAPGEAPGSSASP